MKPARDIIAGFEALPLHGLDSILQARRPLILAPHPDDESLGCGGLIASACAAGLAPVVIILTDGSASHPGSLTHPPRRLAATRKAEATQAMQLLGLPADHLYCLPYADTKLPHHGPEFDTAAAAIAEIALSHGCRLVIGPWDMDPHCDHEAGAEIAAAVAATTRLPLLSYPVWGWLLPPETPVRPPHTGWRLDISQHITPKRQAIAAHQSQYGELIKDSSAGFTLPANLLEIFHRPYEVYLRA